MPTAGRTVTTPPFHMNIKDKPQLFENKTALYCVAYAG